MCISISRTYTITEEKVKQYALLSGDFNAIHLDQKEAERYGFKAPIAYGMLTMGLISNISTDFVAEGMRISAYEMQFLKPVFINKEILVIADIKRQENNRFHPIMITGWVENELAVKGKLTLEQ